MFGGGVRCFFLDKDLVIFFPGWGTRPRDEDKCKL